jgi:hypothetical protein
MTPDIAERGDFEETSIPDAARMLGVSPAHVEMLIDAGLLPQRTGESSQRVRTSDLLAYKELVERRHAALDELIAESQEMGLYDAPPTRFVR